MNPTFTKKGPTPISYLRSPTSDPVYQILSTKYLLYTGVWREHKNLKRLMEAFLAFAKENQNINLVITGKYDPLYAEIINMPEQARLQDRVHFVGHVSEGEIIALYQNALAFVFPSLYEGFGLPPLEAMACGVPVVCSNTSSLPEVCGDAALYFDPLSLTDIREKIERITSDEDLRSELIHKGLGNIRRFSWRMMTERTLEIYKQALDL